MCPRPNVSSLQLPSFKRLDAGPTDLSVCASAAWWRVPYAPRHIIMGDTNRGTRGILGVAHSKHRPMMFSFCPVRGDEWPSNSDDSDEDFDVKKCNDFMVSDGGEDLIVNPTKNTKKQMKNKAKLKQKKAKKKKKGSKRKANDHLTSKNGQKRKRRRLHSSKEGHVQTAAGTVSDHESTDDSCLWDRLPVLILHRIFHFCVQEDGAVPFLLRMSRVCRTWNEAAKSPLLWRYVNLDQRTVKIKEDKRYKALSWLVENRFSKIEELNLSRWSRLHHSSLEKLLEKCPTIKKINLTGCIKLNSASISSLVERLPDLASVDLTNISLPGQCLPANVSLLWEKKASQLEELVLSGNRLQRWPKLFDPVLNIPNSMPKLTLLDFSNCSFTSSSVVVFPVEAFQLACPNLQTLCLAGCSLTGSRSDPQELNSSKGFPRLKQLSFPVPRQIHRTSWQQQDLLQRLLKTSEKLQLLDIRGHSSFTSEFSQNLPCTDVEYLYISQGDQNMLTLCEKWSHSLIVLDMSDLSVEDDMAISSLLPSLTKLKQLDLSGTDIEDSALRLIFENCPALTELNLTRCRNISRGMKQCFKDQRLQELSAKFMQL